MEISQIVLLFSVGLVAGFASGLIGIGGGLFYVIVYSYFLEKIGVDNESELVRMVISNSILSTFFAALSSSIKQYRLNYFFPKPVLRIGIAGLITAIGLSYLISKVTWYSKDIFAIVFTIFIIPLMIKMLTQNKEGTVDPNKVPSKTYTLLGLLGGSATALSGLGGSFILTPILNGFLKINIKKVVSIAVGVITIVALGTTLFNLFYQTYETKLPYTYGGINLLMVAPVALGILITAPLGVKASKKIKPSITKTIFISFCIIIIIRNILELIY